MKSYTYVRMIASYLLTRMISVEEGNAHNTNPGSVKFYVLEDIFLEVSVCCGASTRMYICLGNQVCSALAGTNYYH